MEKPLEIPLNCLFQGCTILAGAVIGDNAVIGAGSVVKGEIPGGVVAVGVPCKVLRPVTEANKNRYPPAFQSEKLPVKKKASQGLLPWDAFYTF